MLTTNAVTDSHTDLQSTPTADDLKRVLRQVTYTLNHTFDREQIAIDILTQSWLSGHPQPSNQFIRHRCLNEARARRAENEAMTHLQTTPSTLQDEPDSTDTSTLKDRVNELVKCLDAPEKKCVALRFYMDLSAEDAAKQLEMNVTAFRLTIHRALYKMREAATT